MTDFLFIIDSYSLLEVPHPLPAGILAMKYSTFLIIALSSL